MTVPTTQDRSRFETTKRLLAQLVNEGFAVATLIHQQLIFHSANGDKDLWIRAHRRHDTVINTEGNRVLPPLRPECLQPPVLLGKGDSETQELEPGAIFRFILPWFTHTAEESILQTMADQLRNSAEMQVLSQKTKNQLQFHRSCWAIPPLKPVLPEHIPEMIAPSLSFVSIPRKDMRVTGPFETTLEPLLQKLGIPKPADENTLIVPCLTRQIPAILHHFENATVIAERSSIADAQASMRTVTLRPELEFNYHLKLALACQITSAVRTVTPWTTGQGRAISDLLEKTLPADLWVFKEVAAVTGRQEDFHAAKHLSCVLREDLEPRARMDNETLVVAAALMERHPQDGKTYPERLFSLDTVEARKEWFRTAMLHPLVHHGIALEAHAQNTVVRLCTATGKIKGFAIRDFGGVHFHKPTLREQGFTLDWEIPGSLTLTDDLISVWKLASHTLLQCHVPSLLYALRLETHGGCGVVMEELESVLEGFGGDLARGLLEYFCEGTVVMKSFLRMLMAGMYREAGGPDALCAKCRRIDWSWLGIQKYLDMLDRPTNLMYPLAEAIKSAATCWVCGWLVAMAEDKHHDDAVSGRVVVEITRSGVPILGREELQRSQVDNLPSLYRIEVLVRERYGPGLEYRRGFIHKASGTRGPVHVSDMLDSWDTVEAEPYSARLRPVKADTRLFKFWKDYCIEEHGNSCERSGCTPERLRSMPFIRLVDVLRDCIVALSTSEHVKWVALSYVWGEAQKHELVTANYTLYHLPGALKSHKMPATIVDAMAVTRDLGEQYLWVDSLCIIQDNEEDKRRYIPAMDIIYGQAIVTIINAGADKVSTGIPGLGQGPQRTAQDVFTINNSTVAVSLDQPYHSAESYLKNTKWNTRGWTYQECLLSRRCLIFTPEQAYWQCLRASLCEDAIWEQPIWKQQPNIYRHCLGRDGTDEITMGSLLGNASTHWSKLYSLALERFRQRQVSSESDWMDAFTGILRVLEHSKGQEFFWGMPKSRFEISLAWVGNEALRRNTACQVIAAGTQTVSCPFPSWSWTGWFGSIVTDVQNFHGSTTLLPLRFYRLGSDGVPTPLHDNLDDVLSEFHNDSVVAHGRAISFPPKNNPSDHTWMDTARTEITTLDIQGSIRFCDIAPSLLCFWTSTAILEISQDRQRSKSEPFKENTTLSDGQAKVSGQHHWREPRLDVKQGKFIVVGAIHTKLNQGSLFTLKLMLVEECDSGVCYRRCIISNVLASTWAKLGNLKWELIYLG
ncbi:siderophore [Aspergillus pseudoviridinutans]|uniref:Siderophore n=1 Tax=Aspergillus pseudoviridinutans TaxID=1517512 RepID=A0A9P3BA75_9EURO|nr:siderophore [Aspergillus pseudoviridinutans]GIJ87080.1 siderophore [Aspergillus pseudoviridinutans]